MGNYESSGSSEVPSGDSEKGARQEAMKDSMAQTASRDIGARVSEGEMVTAVVAKVTDVKDGE